MAPLPILSFGAVNPLPPSAVPAFAQQQPQPSGKGKQPLELNEDQTKLSLQSVAQAVSKAKRVAVVCGAGISCASGIPDFRSSEGLFESLKKQYPEARLNSGKDLFDASLFASEQNAAIFYTMIAELKTMANQAAPTAFHSFLKSLDDEGRLFRVYTQNIDGLEEKAGLTYGLGDKSLPLAPRRATRSPTKSSAGPILSSLAKPTPPPPAPVPSKRATRTSLSASLSLPYPSPAPSPSRDASPPPTHSAIPRCIPLHGHLGTVSCGHCSTTLPIEPYLRDLAAGQSTACPKCTTIDDARASLGERSRGVGKLRPDVVLYGEEHRDGERVGEITRRDLMGVRPDLLLVVGTSLKVPGTKRLVRELSKVIKPGWIGGDAEDEDEEMMPSSSAASSSTAGSRRKLKPPPVHTIYLNYEFPKPASEWKDVFDVWMRGDVQQFVKEVEQEKRKEEARVVQRRKEKEEKERKRVEKDLKVKTATTSTASRPAAGAAIKKAQATTTTKSRAAAKAMVPQPPKGKTKTPGGAAQPRARAQVTAVVPTPASRASSRSRSPSAAPSTTSITSSTRRRTSNSLSAAVQAMPPMSNPQPPRRISSRTSVGVGGQQSFTLTFNVTKASVASVTGTGAAFKGRK